MAKNGALGGEHSLASRESPRAFTAVHKPCLIDLGSVRSTICQTAGWARILLPKANNPDAAALQHSLPINRPRAGQAAATSSALLYDEAEGSDGTEDPDDRIERLAAWPKANGPLQPEEDIVKFTIECQIARYMRSDLAYGRVEGDGFST